MKDDILKDLNDPSTVLDLKSEDPFLVVDENAKFYEIGSNEISDIATFVKKYSEVFGQDQELLNSYLQFLRLCSIDYIDKSYFDEAIDPLLPIRRISSRLKTSQTSENSKSHQVIFKTSSLKLIFKNNSFYSPAEFNKMMQLLANGDKKSQYYFSSGYNFFKNDQPKINCFDICSPYIFFDNLGQQNSDYSLKLLSYDQKYISDQRKELIKNKFKIFYYIKKELRKIKKYEEQLRGIKKDSYPLVILSYEDHHFSEVDKSIAITEGEFIRISQQFEDLNIDLSLLSADHDSPDLDHEQSGLFFINPYFLMIRFLQVMDKINQKFIDQISELDLSFDYHGVDANILMTMLISRNYSLINKFFCNYQSEFDLFSIEIPKIDDLVSDYNWYKLVYRHFHNSLAIDCLNFPTKKFPESYPANILNFIIHSGNGVIFGYALDSGVSLRSEENSRILELFLIGCEQLQEIDIFEVDLAISFLYTYLNFGGNFDLPRAKIESLKNFLKTSLGKISESFESYLNKIKAFEINLKKLTLPGTKLAVKKEILREVVDISMRYVLLFDSPDFTNPDPRNHNSELLKKFNLAFLFFKDSDIKDEEYTVFALLNFVGFIEYLNDLGIIEYCFESRVDDKDFKAELNILKVNIAKLLKHCSQKSPIHKKFEDLSLVDLDLHEQKESRSKGLRKKIIKSLVSSSLENEPELTKIPEDRDQSKGIDEVKKEVELDPQELELIKKNYYFGLYQLVFDQESDEQAVEKFQIILSAMNEEQKNEFINYTPIPNLNFVITSVNYGFLELYHQLLKSGAKLSNQCYPNYPLYKNFQQIQTNFYFELALKCFCFNKGELLKDLLEHHEKPMQGLLDSPRHMTKLLEVFSSHKSSDQDPEKVQGQVNESFDKSQYFSNLFLRIDQERSRLNLSSLVASSSTDEIESIDPVLTPSIPTSPIPSAIPKTRRGSRGGRKAKKAITGFDR